MESRIRTEVRDPANFSDLELEEFCQLVRSGNEVDDGGLERRVRSAFRLSFMRDHDRLMGVAAIKNPASTYQYRVFQSAGVQKGDYSKLFELGWIMIDPVARGRGYSSVLVESALSECGSSVVFATSRVENLPMHRTLSRFGFRPLGTDFFSPRGNRTLRLLIREKY